jgi:hypothetical protein
MWLGCEPVPFVPRAVLQCATQLARDDLLHLVESSVRAGRTDLPRLRVAGGRGFSGSAALRSALDELSAEGLDRWVRRVVRRLVAAGLPRPALEVPVPDGRRIRAYLDGYWAEAQLALEVDDWETHGSREAQERDRRRDRWLLNSYGIVTVRITPREIRDRPDEVVADIVQAYRRRRGGSSEPAGPVTSGNALIRAS